MSESPTPVDPHEVLLIPRRRRFMREYVPTEDGQKELRIFFGAKEITFDGPEEMAFGERLLEQDSFMAGSATTWARGEPYSWERVQEWLESLLAEGIVERPNTPAPPGTDQLVREQFLAYENARVAPTEPKWWNPDCGPLLEELTGRTLELGYLELVIPVHRLAHPALDAEGRQVGEMNVFPDAIRMKLPTDFKKCNFPGGRFQHELPMNATGLQAMIRNWKPMLQAILAIREEFLRRYPPSGPGWKLGDILASSCAVLGVPSYMLMRADNPVKNGELDPVLSSMFRVIDGVRMVSIYLLFWLDEPATYDSPMTGERIHFISDRDNHLISLRGVCAGPKNMIDEFLATMLEGKPVDGDPPVLGDWVKNIPAGVDYGLLGIQLYAVIFALWVRMALAYTQIRDALVEDPAADPALGLLASVERDFIIIRPGHLDRPEQRDWSEARYAEMLDRAQRGVRGFEEPQLMKLEEVLSPPATVLGDKGRQQFREILRSRLPYSPGTIDRVADAAYEYLRVERSVLKHANIIQRRVNVVLKRPHPTRLMTGDDLAVLHKLRARTVGRLPYLMELFHELDVVVENTEASTQVTVEGQSATLD